MLTLVSIKTQAQTTDPVTTVNIILSDVISIESESKAYDQVINFEYTTAQDYHSTKSVNVPKSLIVTSSKVFDITAKVDNVNIGTADSSIPISVLNLSRGTEFNTTTSGMSGAFTENIILTTASQVLVSGNAMGSKKSLAIKYTISAMNAQTHLLGKAPGTYVAEITYTAVVN